MAGILCIGAFTSCGNEKKDKKSGEASSTEENSEYTSISTFDDKTEPINESIDDGALSTKGKSEYVSIVPLDGNVKPIKESVDGGIEYSIQLVKDYEAENSDAEYNPYMIAFSGKNFVMPVGQGGKEYAYYDGTFSIKDGAVRFSYENYIGAGGSKINIDDEVEEPDKNILLDPHSSDEDYEKEAAKNAKKITIGKMQKLNETEAYAKVVAPSMNLSDKWTDPTVLPYIRYNRGSQINIEYPNTLKAVDDFLCTDTYGIKLDGSYKRGKKFKLEHNLRDTIKNDPQSIINDRYREEAPEKWLERTTEMYLCQYGCDDFNSTIEFSDGEWEWFNADNKLLNNGKYEESEDYPGLIKMYIDEDSEKCPEYAKMIYPLWFYIGDDGEIYYPAFVKVD